MLKLYSDSGVKGTTQLGSGCPRRKPLPTGNSFEVLSDIDEDVNSVEETQFEEEEVCNGLQMDSKLKVHN